MRGVPEFSLDGWDLLTRGLLSDVPRPHSHSQTGRRHENCRMCVCVVGTAREFALWCAGMYTAWTGGIAA